MNKTLAISAVAAALLVPVVAVAQSSPGPGAPPPAVDAASPGDHIAAMQAMRTQLKTSLFATLSDEHKRSVQAILDQINSGKLNFFAGVGQIDAILSESEKTAIIGIAEKARAARHNGPPPPPPPGGVNAPDPGAFLAGVSAPFRGRGMNGTVRMGGPSGPGGPAGPGPAPSPAAT